MSDQENSYVTDLWGNLVYRTAGKKGRPPFQRTDENANKVSMLLALGWSNERIAACILDPRTGKAISVPTLKRHFRPELQARDAARDRLTLRRFEVLFQQAEGGNVGALRLLDQMIAKNDLMQAEHRVAAKGRSVEEKKKPIGKKEERAINAMGAEDRLLKELEEEASAARPVRPN